MNATKKFLTDNFMIYNDKIFEKKLTLPIFKLYTSRSGPVAMFRYDKNKNNPTIWINNSINWTEETLINTLIHEMIHQYIRTIVKYNGFISHGWRFFKFKRKIKKELGIKISITGKHLPYKKKKSVN